MTATKLCLISSLFAIQFCLKEFDIIRRNIPFKNLQTDQNGQTLKLSNHIYALDLMLGTPSQSVSCLVDSGSFISWVAEGVSFNSSKSSTFKSSNETKTIKYVTGESTGTVSTDVLSNFDKSVEFKFLDAQPSDNIKGLVGFGRIFDSNSDSDPSFSLMNRLISAKIIEKNIFAVKYVNSTNGKLILGDYPEEVKLNPSNYTTMRVKLNGSENIFWNGYLSHILNGDIYNFSLAQKIEEWVTFDTGSNFGLFPLRAKKYFVDLFENMTNTGACEWNFELGSGFTFTYTYTCSILQFEKIKNFPVFNLIFNGWAYKFETKNLFTIETVKGRLPILVFRIVFSTGTSEYLIGLPLISQYLFVFDNEKNEIGLYGDFRYNFTNYTSDPPIPKKEPSSPPTQPTQPTQPQSNSSSTSKSLAGWVIALIIIGCVVVIALIILIIYCCCKTSQVQTIQYTQI